MRFWNANLLLEYGNRIRERWLVGNNYRHISYEYVIFTGSLKGHHTKRVTAVKITLTLSNLLSVYVFDVFAVHNICQFSFV